MVSLQGKMTLVVAVVAFYAIVFLLLLQQQPSANNTSSNAWSLRPPKSPSAVEYDVVVVGAGLTGATAARRLADSSAHYKVLVVETLQHVAGLSSLSPLQDLLLFQTTARSSQEYLSHFTDWSPRPLPAVRVALPSGRVVSLPLTPKSLPNLTAEISTTAEFLKWLQDQQLEVDQGPKTAEEVLLHDVGRTVTHELGLEQLITKHKAFRAVPLSDLDPAALRGGIIPFDSIFSKEGQSTATTSNKVSPKVGMTAMIEKMLKHVNITLKLGVTWTHPNGEDLLMLQQQQQQKQQQLRRRSNNDFELTAEVDGEQIAFRHLVFTGPVDEFFRFRYGKLSYQSLKFVEETTHSKVTASNPSVVYYPGQDTSYTQLIEAGGKAFKVFPTEENGVPVYPISSTDNRHKLQLYQSDMALLQQSYGSSNIIVAAGRLGQFMVLEMDESVQRGSEVAAIIDSKALQSTTSSSLPQHAIDEEMCSPPTTKRPYPEAVTLEIYDEFDAQIDQVASTIPVNNLVTFTFIANESSRAMAMLPLWAKRMRAMMKEDNTESFLIAIATSAKALAACDKLSADDGVICVQTKLTDKDQIMLRATWQLLSNGLDVLWMDIGSVVPIKQIYQFLNSTLSSIVAPPSLLNYHSFNPPSATSQRSDILVMSAPSTQSLTGMDMFFIRSTTQTIEFAHRLTLWQLCISNPPPSTILFDELLGNRVKLLRSQWPMLVHNSYTSDIPWSFFPTQHFGYPATAADCKVNQMNLCVLSSGHPSIYNQLNISLTGNGDGKTTPSLATLVVAHWKENLQWTRNIPSWLTLNIYTHNPNVTGAHLVTPNGGREAHLYLSWIVDHYDDLPERVLFVHAHNGSWHLHNTLRMIQCLDFNTNHGFVPINVGGGWGWRYQTLGLHSGYSGISIIDQQWESVFRPFLGNPPSSFSFYCCATFLVRKERILARPLEAWRTWRDWTLIPDPDPARTGLGLEYIWHYLFGEPADLSDWVPSSDVYKNCPPGLLRRSSNN